VLPELAFTNLRCTNYCAVKADPELYLLGATLILSYFYMVYLIGCYYVRCRPEGDYEEEEEEEKTEEKELLATH
jgi:hypothetical protein